jgi:hypothetical protein
MFTNLAMERGHRCRVSSRDEDISQIFGHLAAEIGDLKARKKTRGLQGEQWKFKNKTNKIVNGY